MSNGQIKVPLSVVVIAKNEAAALPRCLHALAWCDEVVVVDDRSTDDTAQIAEDCGARVVSHRFESFASQRNWALEHAGLRNDWALMLDADEVATGQLEQEIRRVLSKSPREYVGFKMCRKTMFMGKWLKYSDGFPVWIVRLVQVGRFQFQDCGHGEVPVPTSTSQYGTIQSPFLHFPFDKGISHWLERHNQYSTREAEREFREGQGFRISGIWSRERSTRRQHLRSFSRRLPCRSLLRFFYQFVLKRGFLDGKAGLTFSWLMAVYEGFIVLKRREMQFLMPSAIEPSAQLVKDRVSPSGITHECRSQSTGL